MWVQIFDHTGKPIFFPLCCEIRWEWCDPVTDRVVYTSLKNIPQANKPVPVPYPLSTIPDATETLTVSNTARATPERACKMIALTNPFLTPYFQAWDPEKFPELHLKEPTRLRRFQLGPSSKQHTTDNLSSHR